MATYYIDPTGNDSTGNGSIGTPWKTLYKAATTVTTGNTIHVNAGTYTENTQIPLAAGVNLEGEGDTSIITSTSFGSEGQYLINMRSVTLVDGNQTISYLKFDGNNNTVSRCLDILRRHNVKIHHCTFINFKYEGIMWGGDGTGNVGVDPPGYDEDTPPTVYVTGSEFHDNTMISCSVYDSYGHGSLCLGGHEGMLIYNNTIECLTRISGSPGYCIKTQYPGFMRGMKVYNNTLSTGSNAWLFAIEGFFFYGCEFYNNTILGAIDINGTNKGAAPSYDYGAWIHDNIIGPESSSTSAYEGCIFEFNTSDVIIERNLFRNLQTGLLFTPRTNCIVKDYQIRYNIFSNLKSGAYAVSGGTASGTFNFDNIKFFNNVFHGSPIWGLSLFGTWSNFYFENNIFTGAGWQWCGFRQNVATNVYIRNNILYNNATNTPQFIQTPVNYVNSGNINSNPLYVSAGSDFSLQAGSPAINAGRDVGLTTDYRGYIVPINGIPDIGAYEYGSYPEGIFYVAASGGNNANPGTQTQPWATLAYGVANAGSGNTVYLLPGTHAISSQISVPVGVNITGAGDTSIISSTLSTTWQATLLLHSATQGTNGNQSISYIKMDGNSTTAWGAIQINARSNVHIHHCTFVNFFSCGIIFNANTVYGGPPSVYATGNKYYNNISDNCSDYPLADDGQGHVMFGGQDGIEIYNNTMTQTTRSIRRNGYLIKFYSYGYSKGFKIYNNYLDRAITSQAFPYYDFAIETWHTEGGAEIYNNVMTGGIDVGGGITYNCLVKNGYDYGIWIHDNIIGPTTYAGTETTGIYLECNAEYAIIERNHIKNYYNGIMFSPNPGQITQRHEIRYNLFTDVRYYGIRFINGSTGGIARYINIDNNVFTAGSGSLIGIGLLSVGTTSYINARNNIIQGFGYAALFANGSSGQTMDHLNIQNNILYNNASSNDPVFQSLTPTNYVLSGNIKSNPNFVGGSPYSYKLNAGSPGIDAGLNIGLTTDFLEYVVPYNSVPDIGAYEYGSDPGVEPEGNILIANYKTLKWSIV